MSNTNSQSSLSSHPTKLSSDEYSYVIEDDVRGGVTITLTQTSTGKTKLFYQVVGGPGLLQHMDSLTDDLCSQWFNERPKKEKKVKNAA